MHCSLFFEMAVCCLGFAAPVQSNAAPSVKQLESLVEQLASPNEPPTRRGGPSARYPANYDKAAQKAVWKSFGTLSRAGIDAFPVLIKHLDDKRYSSTHDTGFVDENWTVGKSCYLIIQCHVQPYGTQPYPKLAKGERFDEFKKVFRPDYALEHGLNNSKEAEEWWNARQGKTLAEIQAEAIEWVIEEESRTPGKYSDEEQNYLNGHLTKIRESGKALPPASPPIAK